jgi:phage shock protein PspC (stress-responsive transcriptional regulator)
MALERSKEHRLIAGVCGGIAERLGWSPILVRVLYIVLPFLGVPTYIVLWIVMPEAKAEETGAVPRAAGPASADDT